MELRPHDIVSFSKIEDILIDKPMPDWASVICEGELYGVVRRDSCSDGSLIPVGLRGTERGQRLGGWILAERISSVISPLSLTNPLLWKIEYGRVEPGTVESLRNITPLLDQTGLKWGPTGSTGFELGTARKAVKDTSDLDLVIYVPEKITVSYGQLLLEQIQERSLCRLDVQLETPLGGVSLAEYIRSGDVLVKTDKGPCLISGENLWNSQKS